MRHNVFDDSLDPEDLRNDRFITLNAQVQFCVDYMNERGLLEEHCLTFPDGETVWATQTLEVTEE